MIARLANIVRRNSNPPELMPSANSTAAVSKDVAAVFSNSDSLSPTADNVTAACLSIAPIPEGEVAVTPPFDDAFFRFLAGRSDAPAALLNIMNDNVSRTFAARATASAEHSPNSET